MLLRGEEILTNTEEMGVIAETTLHRHLFAYYYRDIPEIVYWKDPATQKEVDIIVRSPNYIFPFEVKYREQPNLSSSSGLVTFCRLEQVRKAFWVTKQDRDFGVTVFDVGVEIKHGKLTIHTSEDTGTLLLLFARSGGEIVVEIDYSILESSLA